MALAIAPCSKYGSIRTKQLLETVQFYRDVVGLSGLVHHGHQPAFELGNGVFLVIVESQDQTASQPAGQVRFPVLAFAVDDLDQAVAQLKDQRVELPWGVESNPQNRWVEFYDPGGNLIEFAQFKT